MNDVIEQLDPADIDPDAVRAEVERTDIGAYAKDADDATLYRYLRRRQATVAEIDRLRENTEAMVRGLESRLRGLDFVYLGIAADIARRRLEGGKAKSLKTPFGTVGFRRQGDRLDVSDADALIRHAEADPALAALVRVRKEVARDALGEHYKATGELLPGVVIVEGGEKFYVK